MAVYLDYARWQELTQKLAEIKPCPFAGHVTPDQVAVTLGEFGDIWPESVRESEAA